MFIKSKPKCVVILARSLAVTSVAPGVETEESATCWDVSASAARWIE